MKTLLPVVISLWAFSASAQDANSSSPSLNAGASPALAATPQPPAFLPTNWKLAGELWTAAQYHPNTVCLVGFTPVARYHFLQGSRLTPLVDAGANVTATDIRHPDPSTVFESNLQAGSGLHWFWQKNVAFTVPAHYVRLSNAGIDRLNNGVNTFFFSGGLTWFF